MNSVYSIIFNNHGAKMSLYIFPIEDQAYGEFDGGTIVENKPIGFHQDAGLLRPYSNLFYWANAYSGKGGLIDEHPHQAFEILSFILDGEIEHYDSGIKSWKKLKKGDAQIIRAGSGITHAEKINPGGRIFQIWFDPDIWKTISKTATYNDYDSDFFPVIEKEGSKEKIYKDGDGPITMDAEGISIREIYYEAGTHTLRAGEGKVISAYVIEGPINIDDKILFTDTFFVAVDFDEIIINSTNSSRIFVIETPKTVSYKTYAEKYARS